MNDYVELLRSEYAKLLSKLSDEQAELLNKLSYRVRYASG